MIYPTLSGKCLSFQYDPGKRLPDQGKQLEHV